MPGRRLDSHRAARGAIVLSLALLLTAAIAAAPARAATVVSLTFDDGQATQYAAKAPLAARGMHATFYVNSGKVGTSSFYMGWSQVAALAADGNEIGGHTVSHANLNDLSDSQRRAEVCDDRQALVARGHDPVSFAYPYGWADASVQAVVGDCGYRSGRRVGGIVSPNWCPSCGSPRAETLPAENPLLVRTPSFGSGELTLAAIQSVITQAELAGGWVPLVFHGMCETATCGEGWVRPSTFAALLDWLAPRAAHGTRVRTVREVVEHEPPETTIGSKPAALTSERSASFALSSTPAGAAFECSLDGAAFAPCTSSASYSGLADGEHTFRARARDAFGAADPTPAEWTWTVEAPPAEREPTAVSFTFDDAQATQYLVRQPLKDHGMHGTFYANSNDVCVANCSGHWNMSWSQLENLAADGNEIGGHTLDHIDLNSESISTDEKRRQICEDRANLAERGFDPVSFAYPYSHAGTTAQSLVAECGYASGRGVGGAPTGGEAIPPPNPYKTRTPGHSEGEITLTELQARIAQAEAEGGGWVQLVFHGVCESRCNDGWVKPSTFAALLDWLEPREATGTVVKTVREVMQREAPDTTIESRPDALTRDSAATFALSSDLAGATFECSLDGGAWTACATPKSYPALGEGEHTFRARARVLGVSDPTPATWVWTVDTTPPDTSITAGPSGLVASGSASFAFSATEAGASFECRLDAEEWKACSSPKAATLPDGAHTFAVRAKDAAGNADPTPASRAWTIDTTPPQTTIDSGPAGAVASTSAAFAFSATGGAVAFECRLNGGEWDACSSPKAYTGLSEGAHTFEVRAEDAAGNADPTPAARTWTVDVTPPATTIVSGPAGTLQTRSASLEFEATGGAASFECSLDGGRWEACASPKSYADLGDGPHTFAVRARDAAGNVESAPATSAWTVAVPAPPAPAPVVAEPEPEPSDPPPPSPEPPPPASEPSTSEPSPGRTAPQDDEAPASDAPAEDLTPDEPGEPAGVDDEAETTGGWSQRELRRLLRASARANRRRSLHRVARRGVLRVKLPGDPAERGRLRIRAFLLPDPPGPAVRLGGGRTATPAKATGMKLRLTRRARKRLARLWVAAIELRVTYRPAGGAVLTERRVFLIER